MWQVLAYGLIYYVFILSAIILTGFAAVTIYRFFRGNNKKQEKS